MNTRKYPRTLNEAFQHTADYACSVERAQHKDRINVAAVVAILAILATIAIWG